MTMDPNGLDAAVVTFTCFGGVALIIWTSMQARIARIKAEAQARQITAAPLPPDAVLAELKAMQQQMAEMSGTSHQFDISFDAALQRMEGRVNRLETKAVSAASSVETTQTLRNGQGQ